jgi:hypothetical protein
MDEIIVSYRGNGYRAATDDGYESYDIDWLWSRGHDA